MFITRAQIDSYGRGFSIANEYVGPSQAKAAALNSYSADVSIFLSHSHKDKDLIQPAVQFLRSHGVNVYVDWMDAGMPETVSGETAKKLKDHIKTNKKFLVMVTENSKDSRWVPWELGIADSAKGMDHIAALPIADKTDFTHNEYLNIYPKIVIISGTWYLWHAELLSKRHVEHLLTRVR